MLVLLSMTGFSCGTCEIKTKDGRKLSFSVEMKAINSRFFELTSKLPSFLNHLEIKIINLLQKRLIRGRVYMIVQQADDISPIANIMPSIKIVQSYLDAIKNIKTQCNVPGELTIAELMQLPDIFITQKAILNDEDELLFLNLIENMAEKLNKTRLQEGETLKKDIELRFDSCLQKITEIKNSFEKMMSDFKNEINQKLALVESGDETIKNQLEELYTTINKIDIHEEITRFFSHLESVKLFLKKDILEKGKRLDFILQELLRETNTIMAKCANFSISSASVDIKVELEKVREQVQNIL
jgi:uncharacterized protein (TIGR00255 family)